ncbi:hypothetical protein ACFOEE_00430 [Pseudoalteromonas fenneropenaei]|uniref:Spore coat protein U domain-containing protein n=1 Tax=Pseudoalteromonas fenneropenaei TaxID=1737459 RepID=A0ABV7CC91_9GAMM
MHSILKSLLLVAVVTAMPVVSNVTDATTAQAKFSFEGAVEPACKTSSGINSIAGLTLDTSQQAQEIGTLEVWCNTGENATTEYSSLNGGFLVANNAQGSKMAYTLDIGDTTGVDLQNGIYKHLQATVAGTGNTGDTKATSLKITPLANGLNAAGTYSDTITVTVSAN